MPHLLILLLTALIPLSHPAALSPQPIITSLHSDTDISQNAAANLKAYAASHNLTDPTGGDDNRLLPCFSLGCAQCAAIVFFCAGSCVFAELDLPVCIVSLTTVSSLVSMTQDRP